MLRKLFTVSILLFLSACGYPKVQNISGGVDNPHNSEFSVLYVPLYGNTERDAYQAAARRCYPRRATRLYHDQPLLFPGDANRIAYRCD